MSICKPNLSGVYAPPRVTSRTSPQPAAASTASLGEDPKQLSVGHHISHLSIKEDDFGDQPINTRLVYLGHDSLPKQALAMNQVTQLELDLQSSISRVLITYRFRFAPSYSP